MSQYHTFTAHDAVAYAQQFAGNPDGDAAAQKTFNESRRNFLALVGSWCFSAYLLIGRRLRANMPLPAYVWLAYGVASIFLLIGCGGAGVTLVYF